MEQSNIAKFERGVRSQLSEFFKSLHNALYKLESKKEREFSHLLKDVFDYTLDIDEVKGLLKLGHRHKENVQRLIEKQVFS